MATILTLLLASIAPTHYPPPHQYQPPRHRSPYQCNHGSRSWTQRETLCVVRSVFRHHNPQLAVRVAECESHLDPKARNTSSGAAGVFQFLPSTWRMTRYARHSVWSPVWNARSAFWWSRKGTDWSPQWVCGSLLGLA